MLNSYITEKKRMANSFRLGKDLNLKNLVHGFDLLPTPVDKDSISVDNINYLPRLKLHWIMNLQMLIISNTILSL